MQVRQITKLDADAATPYVGETLKILRKEVGNASTVLGFVGAPFTLASYIVEGGSSKNFTNIKKMAFQEPAVLHALLSVLADNVADYCRYQADHGAQVCNESRAAFNMRPTFGLDTRCCEDLRSQCAADVRVHIWL